MEYRHIHDSTKFFAFFVYVGVFACQKWITERVLVTIFRRQGMEAWKAMSNDVRIEKVREHFIVCGYGQVGRTVVDQLKRLEIPLVLIETNEGFCRELLKEGVPVISRRCQTPRCIADRRHRPCPRYLHRHRQRCRQSLNHGDRPFDECEPEDHHPG
jgi:hypothetical protein